MEHSEAASANAVERYVLGEMDEPEAEAFELHFFECTVCTEELASAAVLVENLRASEADSSLERAVPAHDTGRKILKRSGLAPWWRRPVFAAPAFAALALAVTVGYQASELARLYQPQAMVAYSPKAGTRGERDRILIPAGVANLAIGLDVQDDPFPAYRCDFYDSSGRLSYSVDDPAPRAGAQLSILVPVRSLAPGANTLKVRGLRGSVAGAEIEHYVFEVAKK
jgi:hypothetical protein